VWNFDSAKKFLFGYPLFERSLHKKNSSLRSAAVFAASEIPDLQQEKGKPEDRLNGIKKTEKQISWNQKRKQKIQLF
jgi:hypothetical protein